MAHGSAAAAIRATPDLVGYAQQLCDERLAAYRAAPHDAEEHANIETSVLAGGYAYRQVAELIQNAADAIAEAGAEAGSGRIVVEADSRGLWCANTGIAVDAPGVRALLNSHASGKRAGQIGRFGLGFKSLLRLGGQIDVLSRSVCLHFDPARNRSLIRTHLGLPVNAPAPGLRLADPGTWDEELATAPGAAQFEWATTIVFAELVSPGAQEAVSEEIRQFPAEFLLFLPCDVELVLRATDVNRHLRRYTAEDGSVQIEDLVNQRVAPQSWRVFETQVKITDPAAIADATNVHARGTVPLIWATPAGVARETAGRFYAFFPTATETRTLGILNAPWKLNSDRTAVIPGAWNAALMRAAADLIVASLPALSTDDDPGAVLDAFPRELGTLNEPAAPLVNALWAQLTSTPVLPDCDGDCAHPAHLRRAPLDNPEVIRKWARLADPDACVRHLHPSCTASTARIGRLGQLTRMLTAAADTNDQLPRLKSTPALEWMQLAASTEPDDAGDVLRFADSYAAAVQGWQWDPIRDNIRLILTERQQLAAAPEVTLASPADPPLQSVHAVLRAEPDLRRILQQRFNVQDGDDTDWERLLDTWIERAVHKDDWTEVWKLLRRMPWEEVAAHLLDRLIYVRTHNGWRPAETVLRPGSLLALEDLEKIAEPAERDELAALLLDEVFHSDDRSLLDELGITAEPQYVWASGADQSDVGETAANWLRSWREGCVTAYHKFLEFKPDRNLLGPEGFVMPAGWNLLLLCPEDKQGVVTASLLRSLTTDVSAHLAPVQFRHSTRYKSYKPQ